MTHVSKLLDLYLSLSGLVVKFVASYIGLWINAQLGSVRIERTQTDLMT